MNCLDEHILVHSLFIVVREAFDVHSHGYDQKSKQGLVLCPAGFSPSIELMITEILHTFATNICKFYT